MSHTFMTTSMRTTWIAEILADVQGDLDSLGNLHSNHNGLDDVYGTRLNPCGDAAYCPVCNGTI